MAKIAVLLAEDFEDSEFTIPEARLREAGHALIVIGSEADKKLEGKRGEASTTTYCAADAVDPAQFDALMIPGGYSPDHLRLDENIVSFVRRFAESGKLIAAVCHGPQLLIEADVVKGRTLTSWPSVKKDLINAGAHWVDREVVEDANLITSRKPQDLEAFSAALIRQLRKAA